MLSDLSLQNSARELGQLLIAAEKKIATAESCTGGWIAKQITDIDGSSRWFDGSIVSYSNACKQALLAVPETMLIEHGAVSQPVVETMAKAVLQQITADFSVAVSGIAGPGGGTEEKPVGSVWLAWASAAGWLSSELCHFTGNRDEIRRQTVARALQGLSNHLLREA